MEKDRQKALSYAFRLLSHKDYSSYQIRQKMLSRGFSKQIVDDVISYLKNSGYINDEELAKFFVDYYSRVKLYGPRKIIEKLRRKGIPRDIINSSILLYTKESQRNNICKILEKRHFDREREIRYLMSKGYYMEDIVDILKDK